MRATSLEGIASGHRLPAEGSEESSEVRKVAEGLMPFFGDKFGRRMAPLAEMAREAASREEGIWAEIRGLIHSAEEAAKEKVALSSVPRRPLTLEASL